MTWSGLCFSRIMFVSANIVVLYIELRGFVTSSSMLISGCSFKYIVIVMYRRNEMNDVMAIAMIGHGNITETRYTAIGYIGLSSFLPATCLLKSLLCARENPKDGEGNVTRFTI
jgi:hypothetical protein